jgi:hypothetical protein
MSEDPRAESEILFTDDQMDGDERAELLASLDRALDDSDSGRGMDVWEYLERRRTERGPNGNAAAYSSGD